jgi:anthraniloyl-CoA monooxygenase
MAMEDVVIGGGTALTRRLLCEAARLEHGAVSLLVEEADTGLDAGLAADVAVTAVLSGRTDLVSFPEAGSVTGGAA